MGLMISCKEATLMVEKGHEQPLSLGATLKLKFHLTVCKVCAIYAKQSLLIHKSLEKLAKPSTDKKDLELLQKKIKSKIL
jgi:hypothetical protein